MSTMTGNYKLNFSFYSNWKVDSSQRWDKSSSDIIWPSPLTHNKGPSWSLFFKCIVIQSHQQQHQQCNINTIIIHKTLYKTEDNAFQFIGMYHGILYFLHHYFLSRSESDEDFIYRMLLLLIKRWNMFLVNQVLEFVVLKLESFGQWFHDLLKFV